jgi:hypothetical protein
LNYIIQGSAGIDVLGHALLALQKPEMVGTEISDGFRKLVQEDHPGENEPVAKRLLPHIRNDRQIYIAGRSGGLRPDFGPRPAQNRTFYATLLDRHPPVKRTILHSGWTLAFYAFHFCSRSVPHGRQICVHDPQLGSHGDTMSEKW